MKAIEKLSLEQLKELLASLKEYKDITKKLGDRGQELYFRNLSGKSLFEVEYFPSLSKDDVYESALEVYKKVFSETPTKDEVVFTEKESILGGMKVYKDDSMVDMSFAKVEKLLRK